MASNRRKLVLAVGAVGICAAVAVAAANDQADRKPAGYDPAIAARFAAHVADCDAKRITDKAFCAKARESLDAMERLAR